MAQKSITITTAYAKKQELTNAEWKNWQHKDIFDDSIPGISLDKAYSKILSDKKGNTIIVALLDNRIDANHEDIKDFIWINKDEIPNNNIDDDNNGYIDDTNGWNFLGNKDGVNVDKAKFESTRIVGRYAKKFAKKDSNEISTDDIKDFRLYNKAKKSYTSSLKEVENFSNFLDSYDQEKLDIEKELSKMYPDTDLSIEFLEKVEKQDSSKAKIIEQYIIYLKYPNWSNSRRVMLKNYLNIHLEQNYKERLVIGDNVYDINDTDYGNGNINAKKSSSHDHAIKVAGVLAANRNNNLGIKGISNVLKVMPVCVSPTGDEHDKDIALGIRYAVNNNASIIIMTFTKSLVQNEDWLNNAIKYAADNDVLIVLAAGNSSANSDEQKTYPNDFNSSNLEYVNNVIVAGGTGNLLDETFVANFSNYGKNNVDIFAPSRYIYTTKRNDEYGYESGTSIAAPIVAGIAALIRSYYPNLTAAEVKQIILESGVSYDIMVNKPSTGKEKELVPFSSLSKTGKIVNAYNALLMAEEVSKKKKK